MYTMDRDKLWRHKKRGTIYEIVTDCASLQCAAEPQFESVYANEDWTVYRNVTTSAVWIRPTKEFLDGRFEPIAR